MTPRPMLYPKRRDVPPGNKRRLHPPHLQRRALSTENRSFATENRPSHQSPHQTSTTITSPTANEANAENTVYTKTLLPRPYRLIGNTITVHHHTRLHEPHAPCTQHARRYTPQPPNTLAPRCKQSRPYPARARSRQLVRLSGPTHRGSTM